MNPITYTHSGKKMGLITNGKKSDLSAATLKVR
jgi:hypothetical protein